MDFADGTFIIGVCLFYVGIAAVIGITIYKVVKIICLTISKSVRQQRRIYRVPEMETGAGPPVMAAFLGSVKWML